MINSDFWKDKKVLVTGHTGFKGSWLCIWLLEMGAEVIGYALDPYTTKDNFVLSGLSEKMIDIRGDIRDRKKLEEVFLKFKPEVVFHLAAQPLVLQSYEIPVETYEINVMGSIHVMESIRKCTETKIAIMITTDKCYENKEQLWGYRENDALGGFDPYSSSKGAAEIAINSWRQSFFNPKENKMHGKAISSVRAGNVIGGGDWAKDRIIPDCIKAIEANRSIEIRSPESIRPWEHVLEPLGGYILLAEKMAEDHEEYSSSWNFGPNLDSVVTVWEIAEKLIENYGRGTLLDISGKQTPHEAKLLALDISKARFKLGWKPILNIDETMKMVSEWYSKYEENEVYTLCVKQIEMYIGKLQK